MAGNLRLLGAGEREDTGRRGGQRPDWEPLGDLQGTSELGKSWCRERYLFGFS